MAWGYWSAHSLTPGKSARHGRSVSPVAMPVPILQARSRDHSLDRDRREMEQSLCPTPARSSVCVTPAPNTICPPTQNHVSGGGGGVGGDRGICWNYPLLSEFDFRVC